MISVEIKRVFVDHVVIYDDQPAVPWLIVRYDIRNGSNEDIYAYNYWDNHEYSYHAKPRLPGCVIPYTSRLAHTLYKGQGKALLFCGVYEWQFPAELIGCEVSPPALRLPGASWVGAGGTSMVCLTLPLPLLEWHSYDSVQPDDPGVQRAPVQSLDLVIEYTTRSNLLDTPDELYRSADSDRVVYDAASRKRERAMASFDAPEPMEIVWNPAWKRQIRGISFDKVPPAPPPQQPVPGAAPHGQDGGPPFHLLRRLR